MNQSLGTVSNKLDGNYHSSVILTNRCLFSNETALQLGQTDGDLSINLIFSQICSPVTPLAGNANKKERKLQWSPVAQAS